MTNRGLVAPNSAGVDGELPSGGAIIEMIKDVDATLTDTTQEGGVAFYSIGTESNKFNATFDGKGHKITDFTQVADGNPGGIGVSLGFFGYVGNNGVVRNLKLIDVDISGTAVSQGYFAGFVNRNYGWFEACCCVGTVDGSSTPNYCQAAGFCGYNEGDLLACFACATVRCAGTASWWAVAGGFCVQNEGLCSGCFARGTVDVEDEDVDATMVGGFLANGSMHQWACYSACHDDDALTLGARHRGGFCAGRPSSAVAVFFDNEVAGSPAYRVADEPGSGIGQSTRQMKGLDPIEGGKTILQLLNAELETKGLTTHRFVPDRYNINDGYPILDWQVPSGGGAGQIYPGGYPYPPYPSGPATYSFKTSADPGGSIKATYKGGEPSSVLSIPVDGVGLARPRIIITLQPGYILKEILVNGTTSPVVPTGSENTKTFTYSLEGITHDINMQAVFARNLQGQTASP